jgi:hypothetical protein
MLAEVNQTVWIEKFRQVLEYYVPPVESTPAVNVGGLVAIIAGLILVFRGGKFERIVVAAFSLVLGGWLGYQLSVRLNLPGPFTVAVAGIALAAIGFKFYKMWLAAGSVFVLFGIAVAFQLGQGDLQRYLPTSERVSNTISGGKITLPSPEQQLRNSRNDWRDQVKFVLEKVGDELKQFGLSGWLLPVCAAIIGGVLAYWALRAFAVIWLGFIGAHIAVIGASTILCANWHDVRNSMFANPQFPAAAALGLWLLGLVLQAKEARFPKKIDKEPAKEPPKP